MEMRVVLKQEFISAVELKKSYFLGSCVLRSSSCMDHLVSVEVTACTVTSYSKRYVKCLL